MLSPWLLLLFAPLMAVMVFLVSRLLRRVDKRLDDDEVRSKLRIWPTPPSGM